MISGTNKFATFFTGAMMNRLWNDLTEYANDNTNNEKFTYSSTADIA
jgi:hypothetical protein